MTKSATSLWELVYNNYYIIKIKRFQGKYIDFAINPIGFVIIFVIIYN